MDNASDQHPTPDTQHRPKLTALAGGIGAAKLLLGLAGVMPAEDLTIIANTGDDIELYGLRISPDIDTVTYTLAGVINEATGWGIKGDGFECLEWMARYGEARWFNLGDRDLATHIYRTNQLQQGRTLTEVTDHLRRALNVAATILPMTDDYTPTRVVTDEGEMHFQQYFVGRRAEPRVRALRFDNIEAAQPARGVREAIREAELIVICPSNPFISIGPILAVPGIRDELRATKAAVVAITPIIEGRALKGPAADMLRDLGYETSARAVAEMYRDFCDVFVLDARDADLRPQIEALGLRVAVTDTVMMTLADKQRLARDVLGIVPSDE
ncbi:MAG TPA: 2-phospho-L-lactate transferase [Blastocatellia bacterium]|nr:2-phospho-L-lactate transferase [Blastocatellia bacterium]